MAERNGRPEPSGAENFQPLPFRADANDVADFQPVPL